MLVRYLYGLVVFGRIEQIEEFNEHFRKGQSGLHDNDNEKCLCKGEVDIRPVGNYDFAEEGHGKYAGTDDTNRHDEGEADTVQGLTNSKQHYKPRASQRNRHHRAVNFVGVSVRQQSERIGKPRTAECVQRQNTYGKR